MPGAVRLDLPGHVGSQRHGLLPVLDRDIFVHLRQRLRGLWQGEGAGLRLTGEAFQRIGADPVLRHAIGVEIGQAQQILRARIAPVGGVADIGQRGGMLAALEQQQAVIVARLHMALRRRLGIQHFGPRQILRHAPAQLIRLAQIELRIGIALVRQGLPFAHGGWKIAA